MAQHYRSPTMAPSPTFPSPSSSISDSTLPTPDQPYTSSRPSLVSQQDPNTSPPLPMDPTPKQPGDECQTLVAPINPSSRRQDPPEDIFTVPAPNPRFRSGSHDITTSNPGMAPRRSAAHPTTRAAPPPPILLRRPAGESEDVPLATGSSASSGPQSPQAAPVGLNISGLPANTSSIDLEEEFDSLPDLAPSPHRAFFSKADPNGAPISPAWQSFETAFPPSGPTGASPQHHKAKNSLDVPFSPLGTRSGEKRFEPTPTHGIHARNLSLFFPQPGAAPPPAGGRLSVPHSPMVKGSGSPQPEVSPAGDADRKVFGGAGDWSFGTAHGGAKGTPEGSKRSKRRGHHHKHSLSHNFFSFLDPTQTNPALSHTSPTPSSSPKPVDKPHPVPMPFLSTRSIIPSSPTLSPLPPPKYNSRSQMLLSFSILEFLIGAGLWVEGKMSGWRCLVGLGYLVVFDAMGVGVTMVAGGEEGWRSVRRPYGGTRLVALLYFVQSLSLVFAAVYIAKESIEQVVLGSEAHEHSVGGAHSHGESSGGAGDESRPFPLFLLLSATVASTFAGGGLSNHSKLVDAVGPLFLPARYVSMGIVHQFGALLGNPFSLTVAGSSCAILVGSLVVAPSSLHSLDSILSLILAVLTTALSYPPTLAFGHVLLQTAPPASSTQMKALKRALKEVADDQRVLGVGTVRCWSIGATAPSEDSPVISHERSGSISDPGSTQSSPRTSVFNFSPSSSPVKPSFGGIHPSSYPSRSNRGGGITPLVVSLLVHVHPESSDRDVMDVTKMAWTKVSGAVHGGKHAGGASGNGVGGRGKGGMTGVGEISVGVKRGWDDVQVDEH